MRSSRNIHFWLSAISEIIPAEKITKTPTNRDILHINRMFPSTFRRNTPLARFFTFLLQKVYELRKQNADPWIEPKQPANNNSKKSNFYDLAFSLKVVWCMVLIRKEHSLFWLLLYVFRVLSFCFWWDPDWKWMNDFFLRVLFSLSTSKKYWKSL